MFRSRGCSAYYWLTCCLIYTKEDVVCSTDPGRIGHIYPPNYSVASIIDQSLTSGKDTYWYGPFLQLFGHLPACIQVITHLSDGAEAAALLYLMFWKAVKALEDTHQ